jgi:hypothetical protein
MIDTGCVDCPYREVERANARQDSYKTAHDWSDSIGKDCRRGLMNTVCRRKFQSDGLTLSGLATLL